MLARDSCCETVELSVSAIGFSVKDWKKLSTNVFGRWSDETIAERVGEEEEEEEEEEEGTVVVTGSAG